MEKATDDLQSTFSVETPFRPFVCLLSAVVLLSSITPVIKYVLQHSALHPIAMAGIRVFIGFWFLLPITLVGDRRGVKAVVRADVVRLMLLGILGVVSYAVAAWGLLYTSVTHYILIYSLVPSFTALFSSLWTYERLTPLKLGGILLSLVGCMIAIGQDVLALRPSFGYGDGFVLLFTVMMAAHIVLSSGIAKRIRPLPANTLMFGSSSLVLSLLMVALGAMGWPAPFQQDVPPLVIALVVYVGGATAAVFLLRYVALHALTPITVGVYHNLVPVCTILLADLWLGESVGGSTLVGGAGIMAGAEVVRRAPS